MAYSGLQCIDTLSFLDLLFILRAGITSARFGGKLPFSRSSEHHHDISFGGFDPHVKYSVRWRSAIS
jgi:hypothetical protein